MSSSFLRLPARASRVLAAVAVVLSILPPGVSRADNFPQTLPFSQNWTNIGLITTDDNWNGVPGIVGYRGDDLTTATGTDPQTLVADGTGVIDVNANQTAPNTFATGGVAEFHLANPVIALNGSGTADAPFILINVVTTGLSHINVSYNLRDLDGSTDNAVQPIALQYRIGSTGSFTNVPAGFVADATSGPSLATLVTPVSAELPAAANNESLVQIRIITTNAVGNDEWVGIDDISITGTDQPVPTPPTAQSVSAEPNTLLAGGSALLTVNVIPGTLPPSTLITVRANLTSIGGSATQEFVEGPPNTFTFEATVAPGTPFGPKTLPVTIGDEQGRSSTTSIGLTVEQPPPPIDHIVISQVYGGGGNTSATYQNDYVELYNPGGIAFDLAGWTLQYTSAAGTTWTNIQPLGGVIAPDEYYLVSLATGGAVGATLPPPNISGEINMSATTGKIALVSNGDPLSGDCPLNDPDLVDFVGYGTATCREGAANAPAPSNTSALFRKGGGTLDTNSNGTDFVIGAPNPRRTAPIMEIGPAILSRDPGVNGSNAPRDASITINFTEPVDVTGAWFHVACSVTGVHDDATVAAALPRTWVITPNTNFLAGEQCSVTIFKDQVHDQDLDDAAPNTDTLPVDAIWTFTVAPEINPPPYPPAVHLTMGNPSGAVADVNVPDNYLMEKPEFALSYNQHKGTPNWVSWHLDTSWYGNLSRVDTFRPDPAVPPDWYRVQATDFFTTGFDRGHMTPNADRDREIPINQATFLMSNMVPQAPDNNQGPWANLENDLRTLASAGNELYIVSGPVGVGGTGSSGFRTTVAGGRVTVPAATWKVALILPRDSADDVCPEGHGDVCRVSASTRTIAVIMPNTQGIRNDDWHHYLTTVDAVEQLTGYDFFAEVGDAVENSIEAGINGVNPPGTANQHITTEEDSPQSFTLDVASTNPSTLTYTILTGPSVGAVTGSGGNLTYVPAQDFVGTDSFSYRVTDSVGMSNTSTVTLSVLEVNDAPTAGNDTKTADEDATLSFPATDLTANDSAGPQNESTQTLTVTSVTATGDTHGTVTLAGGQVTYVPAANFNGSASFTYEVCDDGTSGGVADPKCTVATVSVTVTPVNDDPVATADTATTGEDMAVVIDVLANDTDPDGDGLVVGALSGAAKGTVAVIATGPDTGKVRYTPNANANGTDTFTYTVSDGHGGTATAGVNVSIDPQNDAPVFTFVPSAATTAELATYTFTAQASDVDSASLTFSLVGAPTGASINPTTGQFAWTPTEAQGGSGVPFAFKVRISDGTSNTDANIVITVTEVNQAPTLVVGTSHSVSLGQTLTFVAVGSDADLPAQSLSYGLSGAVPAGATINPATGVFTWTPTAAQSGAAYAFNVTVTDGMTTTSVAVAVKTIGPLQIERDVLDRVRLLRNTTHDRSDGKSLDDVIDDLTEAVQAKYWDDAAHLDPRRGDKVFDEDEQAVRELAKLKRECHSRIPDAVLQGFIDDLVRATRLLAETAIGEAIAAHGDPRDIAKAKDDLADGNREAARGQSDEAIRDYESAWERALKAVR